MEPSLAELTEKAIQFLKKDDDGYFLLVEGGRIGKMLHRFIVCISLALVVAQHPVY